MAVDPARRPRVRANARAKVSAHVTRRRVVLALVLVAALVLLLGASAGDARPNERQVTVLSTVYEVDGIYRSMMGPYSSQLVSLLGEEGKKEPELLWITGYSAEMVGADGRTKVPDEFMCHSNLDLHDAKGHEAIFNKSKERPLKYYTRLFTLSQGQLETRFPPGFGIPVMSNEPIRLDTQVLNLNRPEGGPPVRHKVRIDFVRDAETEAPFKALFERYAETLVSLDGQELTFGKRHPSDVQKAASCSPGENLSETVYMDGPNRRFTMHYVVPPGRHTYRTLANLQMRLPYDTTVHFIAVHLHPFAESVELIDRTSGRSVYKALAKNFKGKIGLEHVDSFSSVEGVPLFKDHDYEIVTIYNNTSGENQDSMAVMYLYLLEKDFKKPA